MEYLSVLIHSVHDRLLIISITISSNLIGQYHYHHYGKINGNKLVPTFAMAELSNLFGVYCDNNGQNGDPSLDHCYRTGSNAARDENNFPAFDIGLLPILRLQHERDERLPLTEVSHGNACNSNKVQQTGPERPLGQELQQQSRFPVVPQEEIREICEAGSNKNTDRTTKTWLAVWINWCSARNTDKIEIYDHVTLDGLLTKFYLGIHRKDGGQSHSE